MNRFFLAAFLLSLSSSAFAADASKMTECHGTEPFWSATIRSEKVVYKSNSTGEALTIRNKGALPSAAGSTRFISLYQGRTEEDSSRFLNLIVKSEESCSDGMSDETYGASAIVLSGSMLLYGCCK